MSQAIHVEPGVTPVRDKIKAYWPLLIMAIVVVSQGTGLAFSGALQSFQGSFAIVAVGTPIVTIVAVLRNGMREHPMSLRQALTSREVWAAGGRTLRWGSFDKRQRWAIIALAVTSALINLGGPVAVRELGSGMNAAFATAGSLAAGLFALRYFPQWLARGIALVAVVLAALLAGGGFTGLGLIAALFAASHMTNLPMQVVRLKPRQDAGLAVANLYSAPFVIFGTMIWDSSQGVSWAWGPQEIIGALLAGSLVMVLPVFLQNWAANLGLSDQDQGAMAALAAPLHALVGWVLAPVTLIIAGTAAVQPTIEQIGLFLILAFAAISAPLMPKTHPRKLEAALKRATDDVRRVEDERDKVSDELRDTKGKLQDANIEKLQLQQELRRVNRRRHAAELAAQHGLSVSDVEDLMIVGLSDDLVAKVARGRIRPFLVHWLRQLGYDPAEAVEVAAELPGKRGRQWYERVLTEQRSSLVGLSRDEGQVLLVLLSRVAPEARQSLHEALEHRPSAHRHQ